MDNGHFHCFLVFPSVSGISVSRIKAKQMFQNTRFKRILVYLGISNATIFIELRIMPVEPWHIHPRVMYLLGIHTLHLMLAEGLKSPRLLGSQEELQRAANGGTS